MKRKTKSPIIVAIIGIVGSGKSTIAKQLGKLINATVVEGDAIRIQLRKQKEKYEGARKISENIATELIKRDSSVILDSDYINKDKRTSLSEKTKKLGAKLIFIHVFAQYDIIAGRTITRNYPASDKDFFGGAGLKSIWPASAST